MNDLTWDEYFMNLAKTVSMRCKCGSRKIGAVIVRDNRILSTGYNGPPSGVRPCWERLQGLTINGPQGPQELNIPRGSCPRKVLGYRSGEGLEICVAAHAERNAVATAARMGVGVDGATMYCDCPVPCKDCAGVIINAGIREVVVSELKEYNSGPIKSLHLFSEAGVIVREI